MELQRRPPNPAIPVGAVALLVLLLSTEISSNAQGLLLSSPQSVSFEFNSLPNTFTVSSDVMWLGIVQPCPPYSGPFCNPGPLIGDPVSTTTLPDQGSVFVGFANNLFDSGESLTLDFYENSSSELPVASQFFSSTGTSAIAGFVPSLWQDHQGVVRLTMNEGSVELDRLSFTVINAGVGYQGAVPVPEPSTIALLALLALFIPRRLLKKHLRN